MSILSRLWTAIDAFTGMLQRMTTIGNAVAGEMEQRLGLPAAPEHGVNGDMRLPSPRRRIESSK